MPAPSPEFTISPDVLVYSLARVQNLQVAFEFCPFPICTAHTLSCSVGSWLSQKDAFLSGLEDAVGRTPDEQQTTPDHFKVFFSLNGHMYFHGDTSLAHLRGQVCRLQVLGLCLKIRSLSPACKSMDRNTGQDAVC